MMQSMAHASSPAGEHCEIAVAERLKKMKKKGFASSWWCRGGGTRVHAVGRSTKCGRSEETECQP
jgi:hypothetical protein